MDSETTNISIQSFEPENNKKHGTKCKPNTVGINKKKLKASGSKRKKTNKLRIIAVSETKENIRKIPVPAHRYTPLKENWPKISEPIISYLLLDIRFNQHTRMVEIKTNQQTKDIGNLQKGADFIKAFMYGFDVEDALALLRLDDLFIETFDIKDVKNLKGDHCSRAIGRLAGNHGTTKFAIENATKTRIVIADTRIHILGSYQNLQAARNVLCNLIMGAAPSKTYGQLANIAANVSQRL